MDLVIVSEVVGGAIALVSATAAVMAWIFNLGAKAAKHQAEINTLRTEVDSARVKLRVIVTKADLDELQGQVDALTAQLAAVEKDDGGFEELRKDADAVEVRLRQEIDLKTDQVHARVSKVGGEAASRAQATLELVASLRTDIAVMKSGAQKMTDDQAQHEENVAELLKVAAGSNERFKHLERVQERMEGSIETLNRDVATLKGRRG